MLLLIIYALKISLTITTKFIHSKDFRRVIVVAHCHTTAVGNNKLLSIAPPPGCYWFLQKEFINLPMEDDEILTGLAVLLLTIKNRYYVCDQLVCMHHTYNHSSSTSPYMYFLYASIDLYSVLRV